MLRRGIYFLVMCLTVIVLLEGSLRLLGYTPMLKPVNRAAVSDPPHCFGKDSLLMVSLMPGGYTVTLRDSLRFFVTHDARGYRSVGDLPGKDSLPELALMGCSFTYGFGVSDSLTYPALLHRSLPGYCVSNLGLPGCGLLHQLALLQRHVQRFGKPEVAVFNYLSFHAGRDMLNARRRDELDNMASMEDDAMMQHADVRPWGCLYGQLEGDSLVLRRHELREGFRFWPGRRSWALVNLLQSAYGRWSDKRQPEQRFRELCLLRARAYCRQEGIRMVVALMDQDQEALRTFCEANQIEFIDVSFDTQNPALTLMPWTNHPSAIAHAQIAARLRSYFSGQGGR